VTGVDLPGPNAWVQLELAGGASPLEVDRIDVDGSVKSPSGEPEIWARSFRSDDGAAWQVLGHMEGMARPSGDVRPSIRFAAPSRHRFYRIAFSDPRAVSWRVMEVSLFRGGIASRSAARISSRAPGKAPAAGEEWVYVDLGATCTFDRVSSTGSAAPSKDHCKFLPTPSTGNRWPLWPTSETRAARAGPLRSCPYAKARHARGLHPQRD